MIFRMRSTRFAASHSERQTIATYNRRAGLVVDVDIDAVHTDHTPRGDAVPGPGSGSRPCAALPSVASRSAVADAEACLSGRAALAGALAIRARPSATSAGHLGRLESALSRSRSRGRCSRSYGDGSAAVESFDCASAGSAAIFVAEPLCGVCDQALPGESAHRG